MTRENKRDRQMRLVSEMRLVIMVLLQNKRFQLRMHPHVFVVQVVLWFRVRFMLYVELYTVVIISFGGLRGAVME